MSIVSNAAPWVWIAGQLVFWAVGFFFFHRFKLARMWVFVAVGVAFTLVQAVALWWDHAGFSHANPLAHSFDIGFLFLIVCASIFLYVKLVDSRVYDDILIARKRGEIDRHMERATAEGGGSEEVIRSILHEMRTAVSCERIILASLDPQTKAATFLGVESDFEFPESILEPSDLTKRIYEVVYDGRRPLVIGDLREENDPRLEKLRRANIRSCLYVPIVQNGQVIAHIGANALRERAFDDSHVNILMRLTPALSSTLIRLELYESVRTHASRLYLLNHLVREIASTLDQKQVMGKIVQVACRLLECDYSRVLLFDEAENKFRIFAEAGSVMSNPEKFALAVGEGVIGRMAQSSGPERFVCGDLFELEEWFEKEWIRRQNLHSFAMQPLEVNGTMIGALQCFSRHCHYFSENDMELFAVLGAHAVAAINNAKLHARLAAEHGFLEAMVAENSDPVVVADASGKIVLWNKAAEELYGYAERDVLGKDQFFFMEGCISPEEKARLVEDVRQGRPRRLDVRRPGKNGWTSYINVAYTPIAAGEDGSVSFVSIHRDITALRTQEEKFRALLESTRAIPWEMDVESGEFLYVGPQMAKLLQSELADCYGRDCWAKRVHPDDRELVAGFHRYSGQGPQERELEYRLTRGDGRVVWVHEIVRVMPENGGPGRMMGFVFDISERKGMERYAHQLATAVEQAAETIVITDPEGNIEYCNPAFERLTGYAKSEVLGKNIHIIRSDLHDRVFYKGLWGTIRSGKVWRGHLKNRKKDGSLFEEDATISPIFNAKGEITNFVAVKRDVTEVIALERKLQQSQKLEAIGVLAGGIAHDFNNLLTPILGYALMLGTRFEAGSKEYEIAERITKAGSRAAALVAQILAFSRQEEKTRAVVDVSPLIKETAKLLRASVQPNIAIRYASTADHTLIIADVAEIQQIVMNLCVNSAYAMRQSGGAIDIGLENFEYAAGNGTIIPNLHEGLYLRLTIDDTGGGIPQEVMDRIFDPFFTTKPVGEGTGLGLSVVHGTVTSLGGTVEVASEAGKGTRVRVYLPCCARGAGQVHESDRNGSGSPRSKSSARILLVDDDPDAVGAIWRILEELGHEVSGVLDPVSALRLYRANPYFYDAVITDLMMPQMSGIELGRELKRINHDVPVVCCTGADVQPEDGETGIDEWLRKPIVPADFCVAIDEVLQRLKDRSGKESVKSYF